MDDHDREWSKTEELNSRKLLDCMKILTPDQWNKLERSEETKGKNMIGVHNYNILANTDYADKF